MQIGLSMKKINQLKAMIESNNSGGKAYPIDNYSLNELVLKLPDEKQIITPEFEEYLGYCKFSTCLHMKDKGCRIIQAVEDGDIPVSRHESYCSMMEQEKNIKEWELKKK